MRYARKRAFTLVEIMVVVLIISILLAIAVPNFVSARTRSQQRGCIGNMRQMESAKEIFTYRHSLALGDTVDPTSAWTEYSKGPFPQCPAGGTYNLGIVGDPVTCTLGSGIPPHAIGQ